jgi:radical SAM protein with 4Fe4S-binding SPASM domain
MSVSFTTNGTLLDAQKLEMLVALGVDSVNFSIDGNEELHDRVRGRGVFRKAALSIKELSECKTNRASKKPIITVNITITCNLMGHLKETLSAIRDSTNDVADFYLLHHLWYITQNELSGHRSTIKQKLGCKVPGAASHLLPGSRIPDPSALADEIASLGSWPKVKMFPNLQYTDIVKYYSERPSIRRRCIAPFWGVVIKPNGDVKFCPDEWIDDYILGSVRNDSFHDIWNNKKARKFRAVLLREKHFEGCNRCSWMYSH